MKIRNRHERVLAATPERVAALVADFEQVWPTQIAPAPRRRGPRLFQAGMMVWEEVDRQSAVRAFRVVSPNGLQAEHWFETEPADGGILLRHTIDGEALGEYEEIWRERIEPGHDRVIEALFDKIEATIQIGTRRPNSEQESPRWRIAEIAPDFRLEDVWTLPAQGGAEDFGALLEVMARRPGQIFSRDRLIETLWDATFAAESNIVEVYIRSLRRKVDDGRRDGLIETVRGSGYRLRAPAAG